MKKNYFKIILLLLICVNGSSYSQIIYQHNFGTATFTAVNPYGVAPSTIDANLSASQWQTSFASGFSSLAGSAGQALSLSNSGGTPTYSLSFSVASGFNCDITAYSFWRQRSAAGAQNWTLTVNGVTTIGTGTVPTAGVNTGTLAVSNTANGLSGTVNVILQLGGASSTGTFRLDDFTLYGSVYPVSSCTSPTLQATSYNASSIGNISATVNWTSGSGTNVLVLARQGSPVNTTPVSGVAYTANATFGSGQLLGTGNYVVYNGPGTSVNVIGLSPATNYYFSVFEYNTTSGTPCYLVPGLTGSLTTTGTAAGLQIRGILVDACNGSGVSLASEPYNEMVNFRTGTNPLPIASISIAGKGNTGGFNANKWPNAVQLWHGLVENANTASRVATLNSSIVGCGYIKEPPAGIIPANQEVIMVTSQYISTTLNSFANLNDTIYMVFQDTVTDAVQGHFANYNATPGTRSLAIFDNLNGFSDTVTYDISLLTNLSGGNGDAVDYDNAGHATYVNRGCQAPFMPLTVDAGANNNVCFNANSVLTATVSGTYNTVTWSGGAGSFSSTSALTTTYTPGVGETGSIKLYCTVANNCPPKLIITKDSVTLNILQLPLASFNATNGYSLCPSASTILSYSLTNSAVTGTVSPLWSIPNATTSTYTVSAPTGTTSVTYSLNLTNACGVTTKTVNVYPLSLPTVTISSTTPTACAGSTISLSASGNTGNYNWSNPVSTSSLVTITAVSTTTGVVTSTNTCGSANSNYTLTVTQTPTLSLNNSNVSLCTGQTATITATSNEGNYVWQPGGITSNTLSVNSAGVYTVTTSNSCFTTSATSNVTINSSPTLSIASTSNSLCSGGQLTSTLSLSGSTGTYSWSSGGASSTETVSAPGVYTATVTTSSCGSATNSFTIGAIPNPSVTLSNNTFTACAGNTINIVANSSEGNYTWSSLSTNSPSVSLSVSTSTTGIVTTTNACGSASDSYTVTVVSTPTITTDFSNINLCSGQTATITATSSEGNYLWLPGSTTTNTLLVNAAGVYTVSTSNNCFTTTTTASVTINSTPTLSISSTSSSLCASGQTATLSLSGSAGLYSWSDGSNISTTIVNTPGIYTATVTTPSCGSAISSFTINAILTPTISLSSSSSLLCNGATATLTASNNMSNEIWSNGSINTPTIVIGNTGTYTVGVSNACGSPTAAITIQSASTPSLILTPSSNLICPNETATLTVTGGSAPYSWSNSSSTGSVVSTTGGTITVSNTNACGTSSAIAVVNVVNLNANIIADPTSGVLPVVVSFTNNSSNANSYTWNFGNGNTANTTTVSSQTYSVAGTYTVYLTATNGSCSGEDSVIIIVLNEDPSLLIPNVFTPNSDSVNDIFRVKGTNISEFTCVIFDRWGLEMFAWSDIKGGWDGKTDGKDVPAGTYFYIINAKSIDDKEIKKQGYLNLFK